MWLIGKINVDNTLFDSEGILGSASLVFELPRKLRRRHKLKVRYFGHHSGVSGDNPDITQEPDTSLRRFKSSTANVGLQTFYQYRHFPSEFRMSVKVDGMDIAHDNVGVRLNGVTGDSENVDYIRYPTTKVSNATMKTASETIEDTWERQLPHGYGCSEMQDMGLGHVDTSASKIEVFLTPKGYEAKNNQNFSNMPNVRMDTVTVVLQLV